MDQLEGWFFHDRVSMCAILCKEVSRLVDAIKARIIEESKELGFGQIAFIPVQPLPLWEEGVQVRKSVDPDTAAYWEVRGLTHDCRAVMADARTIIAAVYPYTPHKHPFSKDKGYYSAHYRAYPKGRNAMAVLGTILTDEGYKALTDPPIPAKEIAWRSGLGKFGRNGLIHHQKYGSIMTLHILLTNAELPADDIIPGEITDCGSCRKCIDACPMNAILDNGVVQISRCLRYHMLSPDIIPIEVREKMDDRMLGCEDCQISCPRNHAVYKKAAEVDRSEEIFDIRELLADFKEGLKKHMRPIGDIVGKNYARPQRILSMAVIAAGNSGDLSYLPLLAEALHHPHPPIRAHSAWAVGKLGGKNAAEMLENAKDKEQDPIVLEEMNLALKRIAADHEQQNYPTIEQKE
jgi:epoxyqueuosine reductase